MVLAHNCNPIVVPGCGIQFSDYNSPASRVEHLSYTSMYNVSPEITNPPAS